MYLLYEIYRNKDENVHRYAIWGGGNRVRKRDREREREWERERYRKEINKICREREISSKRERDINVTNQGLPIKEDKSRLPSKGDTSKVT